MNNSLPSWLLRIQALWVAIGSFLVILAAQGLAVPDILLDILSKQTFEAIAALIGSVIVFYQYVRALFSKDSTAVQSEVKSSSKVLYALNPFRINL